MFARRDHPDPLGDEGAVLSRAHRLLHQPYRLPLVRVDGQHAAPGRLHRRMAQARSPVQRDPDRVPRLTRTGRFRSPLPLGIPGARDGHLRRPRHGRLRQALSHLRYAPRRVDARLPRRGGHPHAQPHGGVLPCGRTVPHGLHGRGAGGALREDRRAPRRPDRHLRHPAPGSSSPASRAARRLSISSTSRDAPRRCAWNRGSASTGAARETCSPR